MSTGVESAYSNNPAELRLALLEVAQEKLRQGGQFVEFRFVHPKEDVDLLIDAQEALAATHNLGTRFMLGTDPYMAHISSGFRSLVSVFVKRQRSILDTVGDVTSCIKLIR